MKRNILFTTLTALICVVLLLGFKLWQYRLSKIHETRINLPTGDVLIYEIDWWGREPFLNDSSPYSRLYIRWRSNNKKEIIADKGWMGIQADDQCRLLHEAGKILIQTPDAIYWRNESAYEKWQQWSFMVPQRKPLYQYLRDVVSADARSEFKEIVQERGKRLGIPKTYIYIGDEIEQTWSLPYRIDEISFTKNTLVALLSQPIVGLPKRLAFRGQSNSFGSWEFDSTMTVYLETKSSQDSTH